MSSMVWDAYEMGITSELGGMPGENFDDEYDYEDDLEDEDEDYDDWDMDNEIVSDFLLLNDINFDNLSEISKFVKINIESENSSMSYTEQKIIEDYIENELIPMFQLLEILKYALLLNEYDLINLTANKLVKYEYNQLIKNILINVNDKNNKKCIYLLQEYFEKYEDLWQYRKWNMDYEAKESFESKKT